MWYTKRPNSDEEQDDSGEMCKKCECCLYDGGKYNDECAVCGTTSGILYMTMFAPYVVCKKCNVCYECGNYLGNSERKYIRGDNTVSCLECL